MCLAQISLEYQIHEQKIKLTNLDLDTSAFIPLAFKFNVNAEEDKYH